MAETSNRRPEWVGTAAENGLADQRQSTTTVLGGPLGPCRCDDLPDRIDRREPLCDVHRRRQATRIRIRQLERRWADLRIARRFFEGVAT
jgi:hypothetical protein